jgi:hypothetical protein
MNPAMIGFLFGVLVGGLGGLILISFLFWDGEPNEIGKDTQKIDQHHLARCLICQAKHEENFENILENDSVGRLIPSEPQRE